MVSDQSNCASVRISPTLPLDSMDPFTSSPLSLFLYVLAGGAVVVGEGACIANGSDRGLTTWVDQRVDQLTRGLTS